MLARIRFRKYGVMKYVGHLDMMRHFQKILRQAEIPIAYTGGFSPHMIMSFAAPLGIGCTSDGEYIDVTLDCNEFDETEYIRRCNTYTADGIEVTRFSGLPEQAPAAMASVAYADYQVLFRRTPENRWDEFLTRAEIPVMKKSKKGERLIDLKPMLLSGTWVNGETPHLRLFVAQGSAANLKPELLMEAYYAFLGLPHDETGYVVHRLDLYDADRKPLL